MQTVWMKTLHTGRDTNLRQKCKKALTGHCQGFGSRDLTEELEHSRFWKRSRPSEEASSEKTERRVVQLICNTFLYVAFKIICRLFVNQRLVLRDTDRDLIRYWVNVDVA